MAKAENGSVTLYTVSVTTASDGSATVYTDEPVWGWVSSIGYVKTDFTDGVDFTITGETSGISLWTDTNINAAEIVFPRVLENVNTTGAATTTYSPIVLAGERVKIIIASGGSAKIGTFKIIVKR